MSSSIAGRWALVKIAGAAVAFTGEATTTSDNKTYTISDATKAIWDRTATITVKDGGVATVESYTVNRLRGTITFGTATSRVITLDGEYLPMSVAVKAHRFAYTLSATALDDTSFDSNGYTERMPNIVDVQGSLDRRYQSTVTYYDDSLETGAIIVLEFYFDRNAPASDICWARITKSGKDAATDTLVENKLEFVGAADADLRVAA